MKGQSSGTKQRCPFASNLAQVSSGIQSEGLRSNITEQAVFELPLRQKSPFILQILLSAMTSKTIKKKGKKREILTKAKSTFSNTAA